MIDAKRAFLTLAFFLVLAPPSGLAEESRDPAGLPGKIDRISSELEPQVIEWRRDLHQHPELSNREFRTAGVVADHLRRLGIEVRTGVAHTGVVGLLRGREDRPVVALRADIDALPVTEAVDLPFASKARATYNGQEVGVMHACGHDAHTSILMGAAEVLARLKDELPGSVKFIFQPAEEGAPEGEEGGAEMMIREGVLESPRPDAIFGLHVFPYPVGSIGYRPGPALASADSFKIIVRGRQTHGARPWDGVDPITAASQIVIGLQQIISRQTDISELPAIVTVGSIRGGIRFNIIPDEVEMLGTVRAFDPQVRKDIHESVRRIATGIAESAGAKAEVIFDLGYPVTINDPDLTRRMVPTLQRVAGEGKLFEASLLTVAEDFSYYQKEIPGLYLWLGILPEDADPAGAAMNHSPHFYVDEDALLVGVRTLTHLAVGFMTEGAP
jgi:amidohydrolase